MKPITRKEQIISAVAEGATPIKPLTREELILAGEKIPPLTREEYFAEKIGGAAKTYSFTGNLGSIFGENVGDELLEDLQSDKTVLVKGSITLYGAPVPLYGERQGRAVGEGGEGTIMAMGASSYYDDVEEKRYTCFLAAGTFYYTNGSYGAQCQGVAVADGETTITPIELDADNTPCELTLYVV